MTVEQARGPARAGGTQTLLRHFPAGAPLRDLHLQSLPKLTGTLPAIVCATPGGLFSTLESLSIRDVAVRGVLPSCLWRLKHLALVRTRVTGTVPPLATASPMKFLHLEVRAAACELRVIHSLCGRAHAACCCPFLRAAQPGVHISDTQRQTAQPLKGGLFDTHCRYGRGALRVFACVCRHRSNSDIAPHRLMRTRFSLPLSI